MKILREGFEMKFSENVVATREGNLILDSHKLSHHYDRVTAWESGERIAPISVDMALTRACGAMCSFCYAMVQEPQERSSIKTEAALNLLDDFAEIGVKSVSLISDGESSLSKAYVPFIQHAHQLGIDVGNATNGWEWEPEKIDQVLPYLTWVRFTVAAGRPESYAKIMYKGPEHTKVFDRAMEHIRYAVALKKKLNLKVTLGIQMVLMPEFKDEIIPFSKLALELGVDYGVIKHCSDDETGTLGVDYSKYEEMYPLLEQAEAMSTDETKIIVKWEKIRDLGKSSYKRFYGPQFLLQISGSGLIAPSGMFFNAKFSKLHIGNFSEERFIDIFRSERYWRAMDYLASPAFDARTMMGTLPIQHYVSVALDNHIRGIERIQPAQGEPPLHVNFL
jgi:MoaA/NifB/PqqE/SkfB family radical SAM enzyme